MGKGLNRAPLPARGGVAPSKVFLRPGPWSTLIDFLVHRFPYLDAELLKGRLAAGEIVDQHGRAQAAETPYTPGGWLWYYREVPDEPAVPFEIEVLYHDEHLLVVDKPHFLASIPAGSHLRETVLTRMRARFDDMRITAIHRLDRDTAGIMLLSTCVRTRGAYQTLFQRQQVMKEYEAVAPLNAALHLPLVRRSRIVEDSPPFSMKEVGGPPNAETRITLLEGGPSLGRYRLEPVTGRKHQLRVHMSALGVPICNDRLYSGADRSARDEGFCHPLQLLARGLAFRDPLSGAPRVFRSARRLAVDPFGVGEP